MPHQVIYLTIVVVMGVTCVIVSLWDKFGSPRLRPFRAGIFITFGLSGIAPATHYSIQNGWEKSINEAALGWLVFMGFLYISGAMLYAFRFLKNLHKVYNCQKITFQNTRAVFPWQSGHPFSFPPTFPLLRHCWGFCPLPWHLQYGTSQAR